MTKLLRGLVHEGNFLDESIPVLGPGVGVLSLVKLADIVPGVLVSSLLNHAHSLLFLLGILHLDLLDYKSQVLGSLQVLTLRFI